MEKLRIHVYADGAKKDEMLKQFRSGQVQGFTTNPTLMAKAGVTDYPAFARELLAEIKEPSISFEVFSDDLASMEREALIIGTWGPNVAIKIPIINTKGESCIPLIRKLLDRNLKLNVTALLAQRQIDGLRECLKPTDDVIVSIFAGRLADSGWDPVPVMTKAVKDFAHLKGSKILWASTREVFNIYQAEACGCHIITVPQDLIPKLALRGRDPLEISLDTVKTFLKDSQAAGFKL